MWPLSFATPSERCGLERAGDRVHRPPGAQRPEVGDGALRIVRDATLVFEDDRVAAVERSGANADESFDAGGRCVIPGFVDSHTHLVFAGDRSEEFAARMAGKPYA